MFFMVCVILFGVELSVIVLLSDLFIFVLLLMLGSCVIDDSMVLYLISIGCLMVVLK